MDKEKENTPEFYETKNLYLACYLTVRGYEIAKLTRYGGKIHFVFDDKPERHNEVVAYYRNASVPCITFAETLSRLKSMIYDWQPPKSGG